jgi:hypothetical protein
VETVTMPFDSGIGSGRSELLRRARTRYVLVLDDDSVFCRDTDLGAALAAMEKHDEIDIMGGRLVEIPFYKRLRQRPPDELLFAQATPKVSLGTTVGGFDVVAKVANFFIARRDRLALVDWDPRLRRLDHADFFTRALGVLTTVYNPRLRGLHARTPFARGYMDARLDFQADGTYLNEKYGLRG